MTFTGIPLTALDFYEDLEDDNSKPFWLAHKHIYDEAVKAPLESLTAEFAAEFGAAKFFRPYRDVRFAHDKTPYKTHQGIWFGETSRYLQVSAAGLMVAGGYWDAAPAQVQRLRRAVADDVAGANLERAVAAVTKAGLTLGGTVLTRVPAGYAKDHPRADLLRYKTMTASHNFGAPDWLSTKRAQSEIVTSWRAMSPLIEWLELNVGRG